MLLDLENLEVEIVNEEKAILLVGSLPLSCKHFKEILLYELPSYEDVKFTLLSKEKFDFKVCSNEKVEGLFVRMQLWKKEFYIQIRGYVFVN